jgi:CDP-paratose 2-epimerase
MSIAIITGSAGLIGSERCKRFHAENLDVVGIDNDMRSRLFGAEASTAATRDRLLASLKRYQHQGIDIRDNDAVDGLFRSLGADIKIVVHTAAQPSHDWAARDPRTDFMVNAMGTLNLLEATRRHCPEAAFIFTSTNKVYGDTPNQLPLVEQESRYEINPSHRYRDGIDESMSIDQSKHSLYGASKASADLLVQEYGRYFGMRTVCFRGGCLSGPAHAGTELHGFLAYLMKCTSAGIPYRVFG